MAGRQQNGDHDWLEWGPRRPQAALWGSLRLQQQAHSTGAISAISHLQSREKVWQEFADWILKYSSWHGKPETNYITCKSFSLALVKFVSLWFFVSFCSSFSFIGLNIFYTIIHISWLCPFTFFSPYQVAFLFIYFSFLSVFKKLILLFLSAFFLFETVT